MFCKKSYRLNKLNISSQYSSESKLNYSVSIWYLDDCSLTMCCVGPAIDNINLISVLQLNFLQYQIVIDVITVMVNGTIIIIIIIITFSLICEAQMCISHNCPITCQTFSLSLSISLFFLYTTLFTHHCLATGLTMFI